MVGAIPILLQSVSIGLLITLVQTTDFYCSSLLPLANTGTDSTAQLQNCIDSTESGGTLTLPVGRFSLDSGLLLSKPIKIISAELTRPCSMSDIEACPILQASPLFYSPIGVLSNSKGVGSIWIERVVIDGNRENRLASRTATECSENVNNRNAGRNVFMDECIDCIVANSVIANAVCASGFVLIGSHITIENTIFLNNGEHDEHYMWADGLTCLNCDYSTFTGNIFQGNSDIDLILGSGISSKISSNRFIHDSSRPVFGALMLDNFNGGASGNFSGLVAVQNSIDCVSLSCCYGIELGPHPWYASAPIIGGFTIADNKISGASVGINLDAAGYFDSPVILDGNIISDWAVAFTCTWLCNREQQGQMINSSPDSTVQYSNDNKPTSGITYKC